MTKPPTIRPEGAVDRMKALGDGIARLRAATGKPEQRVILMACSTTGNRFTITYERTDARQTFRLVRVEKTPLASGIAAAPARSGAQTDPNLFSADDFEATSVACPWCGNDDGRVYHDRCATNYCGGARFRGSGGERRFTCQACSFTFDLVTATEIHTTAGTAGGSGPGGRLLDQAKRDLLPGWRK